jgi:hypothetical protein
LNLNFIFVNTTITNFKINIVKKLRNPMSRSVVYLPNLRVICNKIKNSERKELSSCCISQLKFRINLKKEVKI